MARAGQSRRPASIDSRQNGFGFHVRRQTAQTVFRRGRQLTAQHLEEIVFGRDVWK
jgi:hypothetical protein